MSGGTTDPNKIRISREILSDGPGYELTNAQRATCRPKKMHMGHLVKSVYHPTSPEWEPPGYLADLWWKLVNEAGNPVGLKVFIRSPEMREDYRITMDACMMMRPRNHRPPRQWLPFPVFWPWRRRRKSKLLFRVHSPAEEAGLSRWLRFLKRDR